VFFAVHQAIYNRALSLVEQLRQRLLE
jgi:hypothetical protein